MKSAPLPPPCRYFPLAHGKYEVAAGLRSLGTDLGNGDREKKVFQLDSEFPRYRQAKEHARAEQLAKYYPPNIGIDAPGLAEVTRFIAGTLATDWPEYFQLREEGGQSTLDCTLSAERIVFDSACRLVSASQSPHAPPYRDLFDALASQVQEDLAIWKRSPDENPEGWLAAIHLCYPNHWAAAEKIGKPFNQVHQPVAGFQKLAKAAPALVEMMVAKGPFTRFAWGVATDRELNHHPANLQQGRAFTPQAPLLELRIERQTLTSFPQASASLFTIRTYFLDAASELSPEERAALIRAIDSMSPESLVYKGLNETKASIQDWLGSLA